MEKSRVLDNSVLLRLRKVTATRQLRADHSLTVKATKYSGKYRGETKTGLDKRGNKRSDMVLYVLQAAFYGKTTRS
jgi:3D (Asp-Asp-Asp) domain-containing protein